MSIPRFSLGHRPLVLALVAVFMGVGLFNFFTMPRREDPQILVRDALVVTSWPGASAKKIEELVTDPLEDVIVEIAEVSLVESQSMPGLSVIQVAAEDRILVPDQVWDDLRAKVSVVSLPEGVASPWVDSDFGDVYEIVYALHLSADGASGPSRQSPYSPRDLEKLAERIEDELELIPSVAKAEFWGNPQERIYVEFDGADLGKFGLTAQGLRQLFQGRNILFPGGVIDTADTRFSVEPTGELQSLADIEELVVSRQNDRAPVQLGDLPITVSRRYEEPVTSVVRLTTPEIHHAAALVLGISMKSGDNIAVMDAAVLQALDRLRPSLPPDLELTRINDLPRQVDERIVDFQINLLQGVAMVLVIALLMMGWRPALVMATAVPLSMVGAFAVVPFFGVELEQFSIASLIIALGMVVDNAIVVSDNAVRLMNGGRSKIEAVVQGVQQLAVPILTSTLTTVAAFLPMLTLTGNAGEYIASLPIVVAATLGMSYLVAILVTPILCAWLLRPAAEDSGAEAPRTSFLPYGALMARCLRRPGTVVLAAGLVFFASLLLLPVVGNQFFPAGERDQFFIKIWLPESASIARTSEVARQVEAELLAASPGPDGVERLRDAATFVGSGGPRLMLTQEPEPANPYYALIIVNTTDASRTTAYAAAMRERLGSFLDARITVEQFMLGPPIKNPVELRLSGPDHAVVERAGEDIVRLFKHTDGTVRPFSNWGAPAGRIEIRVDAFAANLAGVTNSDVAFSTSMLLSGAPLTVYREGEHQIPVVLRAAREKRQDLTDLSGIDVVGRDGNVPLTSVAEVLPGFDTSLIARRNGLPTVTVASGVEPGLLSNDVFRRLVPKVEALVDSLPEGYFLEAGGEIEETLKTQAQILKAVGISVILMTLILITQYNSWLKPAVILFAIPMGMIGVLLGLFVTGWAMGFMATLGLLSLGGIVINNAIVLVDFIETNVAAGQELRSAVIEAGQVRLRPILLTTLTTIGGLLPLSLFGGALWAPMTNGMIFGLMVSTGLTLFVIPSLYVFFAERFGMRVAPQA